MTREDRVAGRERRSSMADGMKGSSRPRVHGAREEALSEFFAGRISAGEFWKRVSHVRATVRDMPDSAAGGPTLSADTPTASRQQNARRARLGGLVAILTVGGAV